MPKFSVIIPLYNKAPYVSKAIESVLAQTCQDLELIVVNDGSTDNSKSVVEALQHTILKPLVDAGRFTLLAQQNQGVSTARNNGVKQGKGNYVCFLDADDWWDEHFLEEINNATIAYPEAGIYGTNYWYVKNNRQRISVNQPETGYIDYVKTYLKQIELGGGMPFWTGAVVVSKSVFKAQNGFRSHLKLGEDFDLWLRIALNNKVVLVDKPLAYYNQNIDVQNRAVGKLHNPESHEVFNYDFFAEYEANNAELKLLLDKKRVSGLFQYYLSEQYRELAKRELARVNWQTLPKSALKTYKTPIWQLKLHYHFMKFASRIKQWLIKLLNK